MARPKKIDEMALVKIVDEFYESCGDTKKLKAAKLADYATQKGYEAKEYDFRRSMAVKNRIEELKGMNSSFVSELKTTAYKSLDIDQLINGCRSVEELRTALFTLDDYWKKIYSTASEHIIKNQCYEKERISLMEVNTVHEKEELRLMKELQKLKTELNCVKRENTYLRSALKNYLYPAIANEILREHNTPDVSENTTVKPEMIPSMLEDHFPKPFEGHQGNAEKKRTRAENLIISLKAQAGKR